MHPTSVGNRSTALRPIQVFGLFVFFVILDEIDKLVKKSGDETLYNLTPINTDLKKSKVSMIGISNDLSFKDCLIPTSSLRSARRNRFSLLTMPHNSWISFNSVRNSPLSRMRWMKV